MDISDVVRSANFFTEKYIDCFYIIVTYSGNGFILIGEKLNFPHLIGIQQKTYRSNGYKNAKSLYTDIMSQGFPNTNPRPISKNIIPNNIPSTSKMYKKIKNFTHSFEVFSENKCPVIIRYDPGKSSLNLNNTDILLSDLDKGYTLGWVFNNSIQINADIHITRFCISTWIDESNSSDSTKQKYMPSQDVELLRHVLMFDKNSELIKKKEYKYSKQQKLKVLNACKNNNSNLLLDNANAGNYVSLCRDYSIPCIINGKQV